MDFPVEATVHLDGFRDDTKVRELLRSHDFEVKYLHRDLVRVKGSFLKLKAVKALLEQLLNRQDQTEATPRSSSPFSSGAISRYNTDIRPNSGGDRGRSGSSDGPLHPHPSSPHTSAPRVSNTSRTHQISSEHRAAVSTGARQCEAFRPRSEVFVVDADVFMYAEQLKKKDFNMILENHNVKMKVDQVSHSVEVTLLGKGAGMAASKLQSLLNDLSKSLRTQEVLLRDMDQDGKAFLERIRRNKNVKDSVLVCEMNDRLHLIGSSANSYQVKQKLLGRSAEQSGRAGRTLDRNPGRRSSSLPPINRQGTDIGDSGAMAYSSPAGAAGYSPSNYQDDKQEGAQPEWEAGARPGPSGASRRRSSSASRVKGREEKPPDFARETNNRGKPPGIKPPLVNTIDMNRTLKHMRKK
ncbi:uncharacterized protein si:dkey-154b15.1 [Hippoglossus hippoglossus]|uniref:uncharacterized protein si:dkey-154b15.1 n=1 Tax=Hippoglossus hippoglossus TaxID=8267 RepID=UPI00148D4658|nr:uncharacterized protein si:dkey-154b15.1 [Hippoglossus hippoglossus]XP_034455794.1 uncharacterized protein si:dkey-154b15.1 [Hippoglossus hippoglossus]XP_034455795.1 uncharacterized protein si:dkey-154b15.1 [Hippoglossus hippoglossus]